MSNRKSRKTKKKITWASTLRRLFAYFTVGVLLLISYQNCGSGGGGLIIEPRSSACSGTYCGGVVDYIYWNDCDAHILGWAWSDAGSAVTPKTVEATLSTGTQCSTLTSLNRPDVALVYPSVTSNNSGFDCKFNSSTFTSADLNIASITVLGAHQTFGVTTGISSITPSFCNGGLYKDLPNACAGAYAAFGWIDSVTHDPSTCDLTIKGWAWSTYAQANTKVTLLLSDGTYNIHIPIGVSYPGVQNFYPCTNANSGFSYTFANKKFSAATLANNKATVTGYGFASAVGIHPLNNIIRYDVPAGCRK